MRRGNGEGSIFKLSGKRRRPYAIRITTGYTIEGKQQYKYLGYYAKITEAKTALREYLTDPYDLNTKDIKLIDVFEKWQKQTDLAETTVQSYISGMNQAKQLWNMNIRDIKAIHLEGVMEDMKPHMRSIFKNAMGHIYKYGMKHELVDKNIMGLISVRSKMETKEKTPFTLVEIDKLKSFKHPLNDTVIKFIAECIKCRIAINSNACHFFFFKFTPSFNYNCLTDFHNFDLLFCGRFTAPARFDYITIYS